MPSNFLFLCSLIAGILFILAIRGLSSPRTAYWGNIIGITGMIIAILGTISTISSITWIIGAMLIGGTIGMYSGLKVKITALPQMIAAFNGLGGLSAVFIAMAEIISGSLTYLTSSLGVIIGSLTFSGSALAFAKLQGIINGKALIFPTQQLINFFLCISILILTTIFVQNGNIQIFYYLTALSLLLGILIILPIGGADMPIIISILNAYSGWAAVGIGFSLNNALLIIVGSIIGASGTILAYVMTKAMNRSLFNVLFGGFGSQSPLSLPNDSHQHIIKTATPIDAAFILENAHKIIIVPGYGMAVAQAQHTLKALTDNLTSKGIKVKYAIHPVAGRMPGHMNVLLAEAGIPYEDIFPLEEINRDFSTTDVAYVIGANDITNPLAKTDNSSPIFGMPILEVEKAKTILFVKRSLNTGYAGVDNPLFYANNTLMLFGDAKKITEEILTALET